MNVGVREVNKGKEDKAAAESAQKDSVVGVWPSLGHIYLLAHSPPLSLSLSPCFLLMRIQRCHARLHVLLHGQSMQSNQCDATFKPPCQAPKSN